MNLRTKPAFGLFRVNFTDADREEANAFVDKAIQKDGFKFQGGLTQRGKPGTFILEGKDNEAEQTKVAEAKAQGLNARMMEPGESYFIGFDKQVVRSENA